MKVLTVTSVFPNAARPTLGVFVRERTLAISRRVPVKVIAPAPWFPLGMLRARRPPVPPHEIQAGLEVLHPRFFNVPLLFKALDGVLFFLSALPAALRLREAFDFDLIDAHFAYPDGVGAYLLARALRRPVVITLRGVDLIRMSRYRLRRLQIARALRGAAGRIAVSVSLRDQAAGLGVPAERIEVIPNGVDLGKFHPLSREEARRELGIPKEAVVLISVGGLSPRKGFHRVIEVLPNLVQRKPGLLYLIVGGPSPEGDVGPRLREMISRLRLERHVRLVGQVPHEEVPRWLSAADVFCLATDNEGCCNALLEAMACGLPVVSTRVGGNPEVVPVPDCGILVEPGDLAALREALLEAMDRSWDRAGIRDWVSQRSWDRVAERVMGVFENALAQSNRIPG